MSVFERVSHLESNLGGLVEWQGAFGRLALHQLHHQRAFLDAVDLGNIWMVEGSQDLRLALEAAATKTIERPSGDKANWGTPTVAMLAPVKNAPSGGFKLKRTTSPGGGAGAGRSATKSAIATLTAATAHAAQ